ncbi:MAG: helix-turn-helix domain-containing protein [Candidatus Kaistia colombiensis]|nr:MAG: helix-turn-helix domain-containing protein [Kaistia sp.]
MDQARALNAFAALSQETRLQMVRLLVKAGPAGLAAGAIGEAVGASSSKASFHLSHLEQTGDHATQTHADTRFARPGAAGQPSRSVARPAAFAA